MSAHSGKVDFEGIAALALSQSRSLVPSWLPHGKLHGVEFRCGGIDGSPGESFAVNLVKGLWSDFSTGEKGGDLISLYSAIHHTSQVAAARELSDILGGTSDARPGAVADAKKRAEPIEEWAPVVPVPDHASPPPAAHFKWGAPVHVARYLDRDGALIGLIYRCHTPEGKKEILPLAFCERADGRQEWRWKSQGKPRSLYGAEMLVHPGRVLIVEGETTADAARRMAGDAFIVVTWPGGASAVAHTDWAMLAGRDCVIWPDADPAGHNAAAQITLQLRHHRATVRTVSLPEDAPKGHDLADYEREGWDAAALMRHIDPPEPEQEPEYDHGYDEQHEHHDEPASFDFAPLGHDRGRFFFFTSGGGQVRDFAARDLQSVGSLCELASLRYWEMNHPGKGDAGFNVRSAGDSLVRACYKVGIYDAERLRGRGAWIDEGRTILHLGDRLVVDGIETGIATLRTKFIYEQGRHLTIKIADEQLTSAQAKRLMDLCVAAPWEAPESMGRLLAGWLVIAPVCGAMPWRPHIYVTGEAGSGKSWILENLIRAAIGDIGLQVASKTSEPGLRGDLGLDARPVIFDEFEAQNQADRLRIQQILDLARQASTEDNAPILKGTQTGGSKRYRIRSCFAFCGINMGMSQAADESRTVILTVSPEPNQAKKQAAFKNLLALHAEVMTPDFRPKLMARTLALLPVIRQNAEIFAAAIARSGQSRRTGDTIGVLLAGAWSLRSRMVATAADADAFLAGAKWMQAAVKQAETDPEWRRAVDFMVQIPLWIAPSNSRPQNVPLGELLAVVARKPDAPSIPIADAEEVLGRAGVRVMESADGSHSICIANGSEALAKAFEATPWAGKNSWALTIGRAPGAEKMAPTKFRGFTSRGLKIPFDTAT